MGVAIREARREDFDAVFTLLGQLRDQFKEEKRADKAGVLAIYERYLESDDHQVYVAEMDGRLVAVMSTSILQSLYGHCPYLIVDELVVDAGHRGRGTGKRLLDEAFSLARDRGCCEVCLDTTSDNERAIRFYRAYGFDRESILFEKELKDGEG
ncbi:MAG: GNAT family N-acetyltransferase [Actinomycetota bacterium]